VSGRRPTIREVAARAGVSIGTVSHVLTGRRPVRPAKRAAIDAAIAELGFTPDLAARALIARRPRGPWPLDPSMPRLTALGYLCADYTAHVPVLPHRDDRIKAAGIEKTLGGCAANVAVTAAGLGPPLAVTTDLLSVLGHDPDSDWAVAMLESRRVQLHPLARQHLGRLSRCFVLVEAQGSRTIVNEPLQVPLETFRRWLAATPRPVGVHALHLQGDQVPALAGLLPRVRARGLRLSMHATGLESAWRTPECLERLRRLFDLVVLNRDVARDILGPGFAGSTAELVRRAATLAATPGALTVLTLGPEGAVLLEPDEPPLRAGARALQPVDTTGAGDTFTGALLAAWLHGLAHGAALALAVEAGSRSIAIRGAQEHGLTASTLLGRAAA
jgi:ribokinase